MIQHLSKTNHCSHSHRRQSKQTLYSDERLHTNKNSFQTISQVRQTSSNRATASVITTQHSCQLNELFISTQLHANNCSEQWPTDMSMFSERHQATPAFQSTWLRQLNDRHIPIVIQYYDKYSRRTFILAHELMLFIAVTDPITHSTWHRKHWRHPPGACVQDSCTHVKVLTIR